MLCRFALAVTRHVPKRFCLGSCNTHWVCQCAEVLCVYRALLVERIVSGSKLSAGSIVVRARDSTS